MVEEQVFVRKIAGKEVSFSVVRSREESHMHPEAFMIFASCQGKQYQGVEFCPQSDVFDEKMQELVDIVKGIFVRKKSDCEQLIDCVASELDRNRVKYDPNDPMRIIAKQQKKAKGETEKD